MKYPRSQVRAVWLVVFLSVIPSLLHAQGVLENPKPGSFYSGIGTISGWWCAAGRIDIVVDNSITVQAPYGTLRGDTQSVCGDENNGYGYLLNWNNLGDGSHTVKVLADNVEVASSTFTVTTLGTGFLRGASGETTMRDFPRLGASVRLQWQESLQSVSIVAYTPPPTTAGVLFAGQTSQGTNCSASLNPSGTCHARLFMAADRGSLLISPRVDEVLSQRRCQGNGASLLFAARCGTAVSYLAACSSISVPDGHLEIHPRFPDNSFVDIVGDCDETSCSGTYSLSTSNPICVTSGLTWTAPAVTDASAAEMEDLLAPLPDTELPLHEHPGLQVQVGENGIIRIIEPAD